MLHRYRAASVAPVANRVSRNGWLARDRSAPRRITSGLPQVIATVRCGRFLGGGHEARCPRHSGGLAGARWCGASRKTGTRGRKAGHMNRGDLTHLIDGDLEAVVLGTILQAGEPAFREVEFLTVDDFGIEKHRIVFCAIRELSAEVNPTIDAVAHRLIETAKLDAIGGLNGLVDIDEKGMGGIRLKGFARSLRRMAIDRRAYQLNDK